MGTEIKLKDIEKEDFLEKDDLSEEKSVIMDPIRKDSLYQSEVYSTVSEKVKEGFQLR